MALLSAAASDGGHEALELRYRSKFRKIQSNVRRDKREFVIEPMKETVAASDSTDLRTV